MTELAGDRLFRLTTTPVQQAIWFLKAVMLDGRDITDTPINFDGGRHVTGAEVIVTKTITEVTGRAVDGQGAPVPDYVAVVFPEAREKWTPQSRFIAAARPDQQGVFKIAGLPAGRYLAAAIDYLEPGSERDPVVLERLRGAAAPITLAEDQPTRVDLKVVTN